MALYYFHVRNSTGYLTDEEGKECPDLEAARECAIETIRSIIGDEIRTGRVDLRGRVEVADTAGKIILTVPFSEAVDVRTGPPPYNRTKAGIEG